MQLKGGLNELLQKSCRMNGGIIREGLRADAGKMLRSCAAANAMPERLTLFEQENPDPSQWYDVFQVTDFSKDTGDNVHVGAVMAFTRCRPDISLDAAVYDRETGEKLQDLTEVSKENSALIELNELCPLCGEAIGKELVLVVEGSYRDEAGSRHSLYKPKPLSVDIKDYVTYEHIRPKKEENCVFIGEGIATYMSGSYVGKVNDRIVISYLRTPDDISDCDYVCNFKRGEHTDHPIIGIPFHAVLGLQQSGYFEAPVVGRGWICRMDESGSGGKIITYEDKSEHSYGKSGDESIEIEEAQSWGVTYGEEGGMKPVDFQFYYDMHIEIAVTEKVGGEEKKTSLSWDTTATSDPAAAGSIFQEIKPLRIMWGCLEQNALITMWDGSRRRINEIRIGEGILANDKYARVSNIWKGYEENLVKITLESGTSLGMTEDHPVNTVDGWKKAGKLEEGQTVVTETGDREKIVEVKIVRYEECVYNLSLDEENNCFWANGMLVGSMELQNRM